MPAEPQPVVRAAVPADAEPVAAIFAHYVATSVATFEEVAPTAADWRRRLGELTARNLPFLVAEGGVAGGGRFVCGFAYASPWRPKSAYRHTVEDTVYLSPGCTGRGIGSALLAVAKRERPQGLQLWAFQTNTGARRFYERHGFVEVRQTDGRDNEERAPDVLYQYRAS